MGALVISKRASCRLPCAAQNASSISWFPPQLPRRYEVVDGEASDALFSGARPIGSISCVVHDHDWKLPTHVVYHASTVGEHRSEGADPKPCPRRRPMCSRPVV